MTTPLAPWTRCARALAVGLGAWGLSACGVLSPSTTPPPALYVLDGAPIPAAAPPPRNAQATQPTLIVNPPQAASGFDSPRMVYVRQDHRLEAFARSEWADTPARMLAPLLVSAAQRTGLFAAVVPAAGNAAGTLRLSTELLRLQHDFRTRPSRVQLRLRVYLTDDKTRKVLAWQELHAEAVAPSDTPQGGVVAAQQAVQTVLGQLAQFLTELPR